jgi:hypothetical protein
MRNVQSTDRGGELLKERASPRDSVPESRGMDAAGSAAATSVEPSVRFTGACAAVAGAAFPDETSQQVPPLVFACRLMSWEQCGPQHSCVFAEVPSRQAPNADRPLANRTNANTAATSLSLWGICKYKV